MKTGSAYSSVQGRLDSMTSKWWLYALLLLLFFLPPYASKGYGSGDSMDLIAAVLGQPLIYALPLLAPLAKAIPVILIVAVLTLGNRVRTVFNVYVALLYLALACLQTTAFTEDYGFVLLSGNFALILVAALVWRWEVAARMNDFEPRQQPLWKWWVAPLALLALVSPVDPNTMSPDFRPMRLLTSESGLTTCMITPVILAVLTLYHPTVNRAALRVLSFVGILFGAVNMLTWFVLEPWGWWMGVLHIPLLVISVYAFVLSHLKLGEAPVPGHPDAGIGEGMPGP